MSAVVTIFSGKNKTKIALPSTRPPLPFNLNKKTIVQHFLSLTKTKTTFQVLLSNFERENHLRSSLVQMGSNVLKTFTSEDLKCTTDPVGNTERLNSLLAELNVDPDTPSSHSGDVQFVGISWDDVQLRSGSVSEATHSGRKKAKECVPPCYKWEWFLRHHT